jgi:Tfp pilus assembly protein PilN
LNILPAEIKDKAKATIKRGTIEVLTVTLALIFVFVYIGMRIQLINLQKRIDVAKMELSSMRSKLDAAGTRILASAILADEPQWEDVLKEMSNIIPDSMHITSFSMDNRAMALEGIIGSEDGEQVLTDFINTMESGIFHNVKLVNSSELQDKKGVAFELKCWVDYEDS